MLSPLNLLTLFVGFLFFSSIEATSTPAGPAKPSTTSSVKASSASSSSPYSTTSTTASASPIGSSIQSTITTDAATATVPDVYLNVPTLSVGRIELDVENLQADINLNAAVAGLVTINAGVAISVQKINVTITDIDAQLELIVRLGHLVDIVNRVFQSLDLNPLLISALNDTTQIVDTVIGAVDGLLGSITQGGTTLSFLVDNLGNIVQEVAGVGTIVGNYLMNMTYTGVSQTLSGGNIEKTYSYSPLNALVDIVFNAAGQILQATVAKQTSTATATSILSTASATSVVVTSSASATA